MSAAVTITSSGHARFQLNAHQLENLHALARRSRTSIEAAMRSYLAQRGAVLVGWTYFGLDDRYELDVALPAGEGGEALKRALGGGAQLLENQPV